MNTAVAKIEPAPTGVVADVRRMRNQFALALPEHVTPERYVRVVVTAIQSNPTLQKADRESLLGAALKCAQDGLLPDGREAALVVYGTKVAYLPMIAGVLAKVRRSGELLTIAAHVVHEKDAFTYVLGDQESIEHRPLLDGPRGKPIAAYAIAKTKDGGIYREVMSIEEIERVRQVSKAKNDGPWVGWWGEMARKTVLRRLAKRLPMSTDLLQVFQRDDDHYDLRQVGEGAAKLRRLHAEFEDPAQTPGADTAIEGEVTDAVIDQPADDGLPIRDDTPSDFPGDQPSTTREASGVNSGAGGGFASDPDDFDPVGWANETNAAIDGATSAAEIDAIVNAPDAGANFKRLMAHSPSVAKTLQAAINGRRKALADRERS